MHTNILATAATLILLCPSAHAVITTFFDRSTFETAVGTLITEDFEAFDGQVFAGGSVVDLGPFTITQDSTLTSFGRISAASSPSIDVNGTVQVNGSVQSDLNGGPVFTLTFDNPIRALGFDTTQLNATNQIALDGVLALSTANPPFHGGDVFVGFTSTTPFTVLTYILVNSADVFGMDNLAFAEAVQVPEPSTLGLLAAGLLGFAFRRKKATATSER